MLSKPLIFTLTFLLTIINFVILLLPIVLIFFPIFLFFKGLFLQIGLNLLYFLVAGISFFMLLYLGLDYLFGFTVRRLNKGAILIEKASLIEGQADIEAAFLWLKKKFNLPGVQLYIAPDFSEINAYAVGSLRRKAVTITVGLLEKIKASAGSYEQYIDGVKGVLGHEMSHLANGDYLPGLLTAANKAANNFAGRIFGAIFLLFANMFRLIPYLGKYIYRLIILIYQILKFTINLFFNYIFMPIYRFLQKFCGRSIEYRCDLQSAYAFGGQRMAFTLSTLGSGAYFSLFSTHPRTKSRINYIKNKQAKPGIIKASLINRLANFLSLLLVFGIFAYSFAQTDFAAIKQIYLRHLAKIEFITAKMRI